MKYILLVLILLARPVYGEPFVVVDADTDTVYGDTLLETSDGLDANDTDMAILLESAKVAVKSNNIYILPIMDMVAYNCAKKCGLTFTVDDGELVIPTATQEQITNADNMKEAIDIVDKIARDNTRKVAAEEALTDTSIYSQGVIDALNEIKAANE